MNMKSVAETVVSCVCEGVWFMLLWNYARSATAIEWNFAVKSISLTVLNITAIYLHTHLYYNIIQVFIDRPPSPTVLYFPLVLNLGSEKGTHFLGQKGHFLSRNLILRARVLANAPRRVPDASKSAGTHRLSKWCVPRTRPNYPRTQL